MWLLCIIGNAINGWECISFLSFKEGYLIYLSYFWDISYVL